ncbi:phosphoenolpyruvate--protein phosphotransferase [Microcoleus sp. FACHB-68]|uniref:phosphoenolpyruvate--protein phosphotransferase n=1 Tax=Microcoleus sp. FACHB-68 TaxID=2692826 RepID=UPI0016875F32|nr:phosphoenolpyruvate--protein phosphotransferase [Microcoleus sp. FACHB-68]
MVGIVIVSHSAKLAEGVRELALQMVQGDVKSAIAAGMDDAENPFGTDVMQVYEAIESVYSDSGVVVLMDLGSAVMSAEMALEFLPEDRRSKVKLCEAPLVEGTIAAMVQASAGADIEQVMAEARGALGAKAAQLSLDISHLEVVTNEAKPGASEVQLTVKNPMGLHARPAAKFVATACRFASKISVRNVTASSVPVNAKSINQVITLSVRQGQMIAISADGSDATDALAALQALVEANFGEEVHQPKQVATPNIVTSGKLSGIPASKGIAIGPVILYHAAVPQVQTQYAENSETEWEQLQTAIQTAQDQIQNLRQKAVAQAGEANAAIFDAHLLYLEDPAILAATRKGIFEGNLSAAAAWKAAIDEIVAAYETLEDAYLQARSADVTDVSRRVLQLLAGEVSTAIDLKAPAILIATDLSPSETAQLDLTQVLGICTVSGSTTSHSAILARSLGIPAVMGVDAQLLRLENGTVIALDGETGQVWVEPDADLLRELQGKRESLEALRRELAEVAQQPAVTRDGHQIRVMANVCGLADAKSALAAGAEGVGLLRSEFLYLDKAIAPTEEEQVQIYEAIAESLAPHPLIIRTLDIGGDKPVSYLNLGQEANPFLGWRGIRLLLDYPDLLITQLRAILRVSHRHPIKVMFPMISCVREIQAAKEILATAAAQLRSTGIPFNQAMEVGMMVEVPAAVVMADQLAAEVDFFSIGTNDLSQYVMAADRTNPKVARLADAFEPAVLWMIAQTIAAAHHAGIWVGVCGELASSPLAVPVLLGLGVDELSVSVPVISTVKAAISRLTMGEAQAIAGEVLRLNSAPAVKDYVAGELG